jgi:hypothetical protein
LLLASGALCACAAWGCGGGGESSSGADQGALPPPTFAKTVNLSPVSGRISVELPAASRFVGLSRARQVPVGTLVDARSGVVHLTAATASPARFDSGDFQAGTFQVGQDPAEPGVIELRIVDDEVARRACGSAHSTRVFGRMLGDARGRFRTRGRFSDATVRGTNWGVRNRCDGTLTVVRRGTVVVTDRRRHRDFVVHAGQSFLARAP